MRGGHNWWAHGLCCTVVPDFSTSVVVESGPSGSSSSTPLQVCFLEQQNKMLETKWALLQEQKSAKSSQLPRIFEAQIAGLRQQLETLQLDGGRLEVELRNMQDVVEDFKNK